MEKYHNSGGPHRKQDKLMVYELFYFSYGTQVALNCLPVNFESLWPKCSVKPAKLQKGQEVSMVV